MSDHATHHDDGAHGSVKSYVTGLILSIILTAIPFWAVMAGDFSTLATVGVIVVTALLQVLVQLVMFMHLNGKAEGGWNLISFVFTAAIVVIIIGGSLWIMYHLHLSMMQG
ncbi:cytochrome o ubiquinol oxidase subunit IV [Terasakiispira papahanaumokuakeensis]|uniref:Cytochrome bo(3) ubiquinol oxidase subunit 4 n=1 Tax=Terasakiispira papahanaumokuakeensis TaxID=197479 RepID=A0A1E2V940_9GAMM|nr:cytochrome o ubiquinol oxidase subunit IV [Terasakiispira papahanaumokuakeensis]ODC03529.1 cytochrome o ubiquinol oxidase subunit IV [Terasakiispira papahanaumokuakeensis]